MISGYELLRQQGWTHWTWRWWLQ